MPRHIRKGDTVFVRSGSDKGATGKVMKVIVDDNRVVVEGVNVRKKHIKPSQTNPQGGIVEKEMPIHISNLNYFDSKLNQGVRIGFKLNKDGKKIRVNKKTGAEI